MCPPGIVTKGRPWVGEQKKAVFFIFPGAIFKVKLILITVHCKVTFRDNFVKFLRENINNSRNATTFSEAPKKKVMRLIL